MSSKTQVASIAISQRSSSYERDVHSLSEFSWPTANIAIRTREVANCGTNRGGTTQTLDGAQR
jgi:hypothetical protein